MSTLRQSVLSVLILSGYFQYAVCTGSVMAVAMLFRHGDRAPASTYPNDLYATYPWLSGLGELTTEGIRGLYRSGFIKAKRYATIFDECYPFSSVNIYVRSSTVPRCIASADNFLEGFAPELSKQVNIVLPNPDDDEMLTYPGKICTNYESEFDELTDLSRPDVIEMLGGEQFIQYVTTHSGQPPTDFTSFLLVGDTLAVQYENGLPLPAWSAPIFNDYFLPLTDKYFSLSSNVTKMSMKSSAIVKDMIKRLELFVNGLSTESVLVYSGHDLNVSSLLAFLQIYDQTPIRPAYGSTIALEIHRNAAFFSDVEIKMVYFLTHSDVHPLEIQIPGCPAPCSFKKFKDLIRPRLVTDYDQACNN